MIPRCPPRPISRVSVPVGQRGLGGKWSPPHHPIVFCFFSSLFSCCGFTGAAHAQEKYTLSGTVKNAENGEALIGAYVVVKQIKNVGASTNAYGFYSLTIPGGRYTLLIQYLGFKVLADSIDLTRDRTLNFSLAPEPITVGEVVVSGERSDKNVTSTVMSANKLEMREVKSIPVLLGEKDILKTIQLLPGVQSAGRGTPDSTRAEAGWTRT